MAPAPSPAPAPGGSLHYDQWYYGVLLSLAASLVGGVGDNFVRYAHRMTPGAGDTMNATMEGRLAATNRRVMAIWMCGLFLTIVGNTVLTVWSLAFADASLIVPFAASHVIFTVVLAIFINGERLRCLSWTGITLIVAGTLFVVVEANKSSLDYDLDLIVELFMKPPFLSVCLLYFSISAFCFFIFIRGKAYFGVSKNVQAFCASVVAGLFGAFGSVMAKALVEVFKQANREGWSLIIGRRPMWGILIFSILVAVSQVLVYNAALKYYNASVVMPMVLATLTLFGTVLGAVFFEEFKRWSTVALFLLPVGVLVASVGVILLAATATVSDDKEESLNDEPKDHLDGVTDDKHQCEESSPLLGADL